MEANLVLQMSFIAWLVIYKRFTTEDRILQWGGHSSDVRDYVMHVSSFYQHGFPTEFAACSMSQTMHLTLRAIVISFGATSCLASFLFSLQYVLSVHLQPVLLCLVYVDKEMNYQKKVHSSLEVRKISLV